MQRIQTKTYTKSGTIGPGEWAMPYTHEATIKQTNSNILSFNVNYNGSTKPYPIGPDKFTIRNYVNNRDKGLIAEKYTTATNSIYGDSLMAYANMHTEATFVNTNQTLDIRNTVDMKLETYRWFKAVTKGNNYYDGTSYPTIGLVSTYGSSKSDKGQYISNLKYTVTPLSSTRDRTDFFLNAYSGVQNNTHDGHTTSQIELRKPESNIFVPRDGYRWAVVNNSKNYNSPSASRVAVYYGNTKAIPDAGLRVNTFEFYDPNEIVGTGANVNLVAKSGDTGYFKNDYINTIEISAPTIRLNESKTRIEWNRVPNALRYEILLNGTIVDILNANTDSTQYYNYSKLSSKFIKGANTLAVRALRYKVGDDYVDYINGYEQTGSPYKKSFQIDIKFSLEDPFSGSDTTTLIATTMMYNVYLPSANSNTVYIANVDRPVPIFYVDSTGNNMYIVWNRDSGATSYTVDFNDTTYVIPQSTSNVLSLTVDLTEHIDPSNVGSIRGNFKVNALVSAGSSTVTKSSNIVNFNIPAIVCNVSAPILEDFKTVKITWTVADNQYIQPQSFKVTFGSTVYSIAPEDRSITFNDVHNGEYAVKFEAISGNPHLGYSETKPAFTVPKLNTPSNLSISQNTFNSAIFKWDAVPNANVYYYRINTGAWTPVYQPQVELKELENKSYTIYVYAAYQNDSGIINQSETAQVSIEFPKMDALNLYLSRSAINQIYAEWSAPPIPSNAAVLTYYISIDGDSYAPIKVRQKVFNNLTIGEHTISVYVEAVYNGKSIRSEITTNSLIISKLKTPVITYSKTGKGIEWSSYEDAKYAQGYRIYRAKGSSGYSEITTTFNKYYTFEDGLEQETYYYKIQAFYILSGTDQVSTYFDSDDSNSLEVVVSNLGKIDLSWKVENGETTSILQIKPESEEHISKFIVHVNDKTVETMSKEFTGIREMTEDVEGKHTVWVEAVSNSPLYLNTSSDRGKDLIFSIDTIPTPVLTYQTSTRNISWDDVKGVYQGDEITQYDLYVNETKVEYTRSGSELYYTIPDSVLVANAYIERAYITNITNYPNPLHFDSARSQTVSIGTWPDCINLRVEDGKLKWDLSDYRFEPTQYNIYNFGELYDTVDVREYSIPNSEENVFNFSVKIPGTPLMNESTNIPATLDVSVRKLLTPSITVDRISEFVDGQETYKYYLTISGSIDSVEYYKLYINSKESAFLDVGEDFYEISLPVGSTEIRVQACSSDYLTINSELSNIVVKYIPVDYRYYALINNSLQRELVMPVSIVLNADESLSSGAVTLALNDDSIPYEPKTEIHIGITGTQEGVDSDNYTDLNGWDFLIATDEMEEVYVNGTTKYRHSLTLIDRTKLLEYDILPNISFTQPQSVTEVYETVKNYIPEKYKVLSSGGNVIHGIYGAGVNIDWKSILQLLVGKYLIGGIVLESSAFTFNIYQETIRSNLTAFNGEIPKNLYSDQTITLPYQFEPRYEIVDWKSVLEGPTKIDVKDGKLTIGLKNMIENPGEIGTMDPNLRNTVEILSKKKYYMTLRYYIRKHSDSYEKDSTCPEYLIGTYNYLKNGYNYPTFNLEDFKVENPDFKDSGNYDIICEIDPADMDEIKILNIGKMSLNFDVDKIADIFKDTLESFKNGLLEGEFRFNPIIDKTVKVDSLFKSGIIPEFKQYRTVWSNIQISNELNPNASKEGFISIVDAIERCINCIEPLEYNAELPDKHESAKYILSPKFASNIVYQNMECPQITFTGRSLFEALLQLGREFLGVPKLVKSADSLNTIDFLVMDPSDVAKDDTHDYLLGSKSDIENDVSGFVSDVSNMVSSDYNAVWYPSENGWVTPRSTDPGDATITVENCGLSVDKDIYRIKQVLVSGYNNSNEYIDITKYIYEQTIYNALNNNRNGKGLALYYSRGDNRIYGLGILPEVSKFKAALGLSEGTYVINRILAKELNLPAMEKRTDIVKDLKFRIRYVPYTDTQLKLTQFNISGENNFSYKVYNQGDKLISDERYGSSLAKQVDRLGNKDITKTYITRSLTRMLDENGEEMIDTGIPALFECRKFNDSRYYLDHIAISFNEQFITIDTQFTKNYNKINERIGVNSEYREYEIALNPAVQRPVIFNQYCYIGKNEIIEDSKYGITKKNLNPIWNTTIENMLNGTPDSAPSQMYLSFKDKYKKPLQYENAGGALESLKTGYLLPVSKLNIRNAVLLNAKMYDNFSAGSYVDKSVTSNIVGFYAQRDARYVDTLGRAYLADISVCSPDSSMIEPYNLPLCPYKGSTFSSINGSIFSGTYLIDKDSQEALNFTYQMNFNTLDSNIDIQSGLTRFLFSDYMTKRFKKPHIYLYRGNLKTVDMLSLVDYQDLGEISVGYTNLDNRYIESKSTTLNDDWDGYAIAYPFSYAGKNKEILIYAEKKGKSGTEYSTDRLYFNFLSKPILMNNIRNSELNEWG